MARSKKKIARIQAISEEIEKLLRSDNTESIDFKGYGMSEREKGRELLKIILGYCKETELDYYCQFYSIEIK